MIEIPSGYRTGGLRAAMIALALAGALMAQPAAAQEEAAGSVLAAAGGGVVGLVAGGYGNLAVVVLKARYGHYPHSFRDAFGWESTPILTAGVTGVLVGLFRSDLLLPWIVGGGAGVAAGTGVGYLYGTLAWGDPESRWADAAIGAAIGMTLGSTLALVDGWSGDTVLDIGAGSDAISVPIIRLSF